ncbi:hypothetical protein EAE89_23370 [Photorhabdus heterorhabditis]|nr:hypothetical protein [Photorhabdus heterorhabditis]
MILTPERIPLRASSAAATNALFREHKIYGRPRFCNTHFDEFWACLNLSGVTIGKEPAPR